MMSYLNFNETQRSNDAVGSLETVQLKTYFTQ